LIDPPCSRVHEITNRVIIDYTRLGADLNVNDIVTRFGGGGGVLQGGSGGNREIRNYFLFFRLMHIVI